MYLPSVQFSSVAQSSPTLWDPVNHSTPGFPVQHQLPEFTQTHMHWVGDAIQTFHPLSSPSPPVITFRSVQFSHSVVSDSLRPHESQHARPPCPSPTLQVHSNSCPSSCWCHPAISASVVPFSCPQSVPESGSFQMSQLFSWSGQSIGVSALASILPMNTQDWSPIEWTGWTSFHSKGLSRVFSKTTVQKHQFFSSQLFSP